MTICKTSGASVKGQGREEAIARFHRAITAVFGVSLRNDKTFAALCDAVESPIKSKAKYGGDESAIELMRYLRKKMIKYGLAPKEPLKQGEKGFYRFRTELLRNTVGFKDRFPETWKLDCEIRNPNCGYMEDGWDYRIARLSIKPEEDRETKETEWLGLDKEGAILTHFYYNELDHYLTNLVGRIRGYCRSAKEEGYRTIEREIEEDNQSGASAEASEREMHSCV